MYLYVGVVFHATCYFNNAFVLSPVPERCNGAVRVPAVHFRPTRDCDGNNKAQNVQITSDRDVLHKTVPLAGCALQVLC